MKVLILNSLYPPHRIGGAEKSVSLLANGIAKAGVQTTVVSLDDGHLPAIENAANGLIVRRLPIDNNYWPFGNADDIQSSLNKAKWHLRNAWNTGAANRFGKIIDLIVPDVIHTNNITGFGPAIWSSAEERGVPIVHTLRDYSLLCMKASMFKAGHVCVRRCLSCKLVTTPARINSRNVKRVVSNSNFVIQQHELADYFVGKPKTRIFNIIDSDSTGAQEIPKVDYGERFTFGYIGRIEAEKGIEQVLEASTKLQPAEWILKIAGIGRSEYIDQLKKKYSDPRIIWLGYTDTKEFFSTIDAVLISSIWPEPLPRTLIEAIAYGVGAICSNAGGIPEITQLARVWKVYPAYDTDQLSLSMSEALNDPTRWRRGAGCKAGEGLPASFSEDRVVSSYIEEYEKALS